MTAVERSFAVDLPITAAWTRLAEVERWPEWAPHIKSVTVSPCGPLGPTSTGELRIRRLGRNAFVMSAWHPHEHWQWTGRMPGFRIEYDHRFEASAENATIMTWVVTLAGPLARWIRPVFARIYSRNLDAAIPRLQRWIRD